jgi:hypothetical protein
MVVDSACEGNVTDVPSHAVLIAEDGAPWHLLRAGTEQLCLDALLARQRAGIDRPTRFVLLGAGIWSSSGVFWPPDMPYGDRLDCCDDAEREEDPACSRCRRHALFEYFCPDCRKHDDPNGWLDYVADYHGGDEDAAREALANELRQIAEFNAEDNAQLEEGYD